MLHKPSTQQNPNLWVLEYYTYTGEEIYVLSGVATHLGQVITSDNGTCETDIYQTMFDLNEWGTKVTWLRVAGLLNCSTRTIYRNLCDELLESDWVMIFCDINFSS